MRIESVEHHNNPADTPVAPREQWQLSTSQRIYLPFKRLFDIVFSLLALIILSPLFLVVAIVIKLDSPGPAIFKQKRVGKDAAPFIIYKFRSMSKEVGDDFLFDDDSTEAPTAEDIKQRLNNDPRITRFGRFIRKSSIDEFPQFMNVLIGNMSLVGPRPLQSQEYEALDEHSRQRVIIRPGITCIWQVSGRSTLNEQTRVEMDLRYIREMGPIIDALLTLKTIPAVLSGKGAY